MLTKYLYGFCLAGGLFLQLEAPAQGIKDSLHYRQAKLNIWCETIRFVYQDYGADSLNKNLNCRSWESFQRGLEPNHLQVKTFFQAIEKPAIYHGYTTYDAKLQKLTNEISRRLKSSTSRMTDAARLEKVDSLQEHLLLVAATTPEVSEPGESISSPENQENRIPNNQEAVVTSSEEETNLPVEEENTMDWIEIAQWALLLLLSAGLILLWVKNSKLEKELNQRMKRRKQEISAISRLKSNAAPPPPGLEKPASLTKEEVQKIIVAEIEKLRQQQKLARQQQAEKAKPVAKRQEQPERSQPPTKQAVNSQRVQTEPVQQPTPREDEKPAAGIYYDKLPFKGGFHQSQLSTQRNPDSTYSIQVLSGSPDEAEFWVTEDQEVQKYAMQNGLSFFEEACDYKQVEENPSRVRNLEKGKLRKNGHLWQIEKKVKVTFE